MTDDLEDSPRVAPLPILSVTLESVNESGVARTIGRCLDITQADDLLRSWARQQAETWPAGAPLRVSVEFPRRLIHRCELVADTTGLLRIGLASTPADRPDFYGAGLLSLQDQIAISLRLAYASCVVSVTALQAQRVARIVLAYGDPA